MHRSASRHGASRRGALVSGGVESEDEEAEGLGCGLGDVDDEGRTLNAVESQDDRTHRARHCRNAKKTNTEAGNPNVAAASHASLAIEAPPKRYR
jgi:hypothetical protein